MKDYQKYIFDLDYTILTPDWSNEDTYFKEHILPNEQEEFFKQKQYILDTFEETFPKYDIKTLSKYFASFGFHISEDIILGWLIYNGETIKDEVSSGTLELFKYLKENNKKIVILTNWFSYTQVMRLKRAGLYEYIDKIIAGDAAMKPSLKAFALALGNTSKDDSLMIGDSLNTDKKGAINAGIDFYLVENSHSIKDLYDIIRMSNVSRKRRKYGN